MSKYLAIFGKPRYLGILEYDNNIERGSRIVVESHRGEELAILAGEINEEQEERYRAMRSTLDHNDSSNKTSEPVVTDLNFIRYATEENIEESLAYRREEKEILRKAKELLMPHELDMKMIDVEFLMEKKKLFFYFSSDERVDFRAYVRDLAREFKTRIELRQIGVRDETKIVRGIGPCGRPCCCSYWLNQFAPVCIKMVKEQNLALNPAKISGICGRLMCCMCFEHEVYHEAWKPLPNPGTKIKTPNGNIILLGIELHKNNARFYIPGKGEVKVPIERYNEFKETVSSGQEWITEEEEDKLSIPLFDIPSLHTPEKANEEEIPIVKKENNIIESSDSKPQTNRNSRKKKHPRKKSSQNNKTEENKLPVSEPKAENKKINSGEVNEPEKAKKKVRRFRFKRKTSDSENKNNQ